MSESHSKYDHVKDLNGDQQNRSGSWAWQPQMLLLSVPVCVLLSPVGAATTPFPESGSNGQPHLRILLLIGHGALTWLHSERPFGTHS